MAGNSAGPACEKDFSYRTHLLSIAQNVTQDELGKLKFYFCDRIGSAANESIEKTIDLFICLEQNELLGPRKLDRLANAFEAIGNKKLSQDIKNFKKWENRFFQDVMRVQEVQLTDVVDGTESQIDHYVTDGSGDVMKVQEVHQTDEIIVCDGEGSDNCETDRCEGGDEEKILNSTKTCETTECQPKNDDQTDSGGDEEKILNSTKISETTECQPKNDDQTDSDERLPSTSKRQEIIEPSPTPRPEPREIDDDCDDDYGHDDGNANATTQTPRTRPLTNPRKYSKFAEKSQYMVYIKEGKHFQVNGKEYIEMMDGEQFSIELKNRRPYKCTVDLYIHDELVAWIEIEKEGSFLLEGHPYKNKKFVFEKTTPGVNQGGSVVMKCIITPQGFKTHIQTSALLRQKECHKDDDCFVVSYEETVQSFLEVYNIERNANAVAVFIDGEELRPGYLLRENDAFSKEVFVLMEKEDVLIQPPEGRLTLFSVEYGNLYLQKFKELLSKKYGIDKDEMSLTYRGEPVTKLINVLQDDPNVPVIIVKKPRQTQNITGSTRGATRGGSSLPQGMCPGSVRFRGEYHHNFECATDEFIGCDRNKVFIELELVSRM